MKTIKKSECPSEFILNGKVYLPSSKYLLDDRILVITPQDFQRIIIVETPNKKQTIFEESALSIRAEDHLKLEIAHIFESGANEIRVFEMVRLFINQRRKLK